MEYSEIDTNNLESVGKGKAMAKKIKGSNINYPQKKITGMEVTGLATTTPKKKTKKIARKYTKVQK